MVHVAVDVARAARTTRSHGTAFEPRLCTPRRRGAGSAPATPYPPSVSPHHRSGHHRPQQRTILVHTRMVHPQTLQYCLRHPCNFPFPRLSLSVSFPLSLSLARAVALLPPFSPVFLTRRLFDRFLLFADSLSYSSTWSFLSNPPLLRLFSLPCFPVSFPLLPPILFVFPPRSSLPLTPRPSVPFISLCSPTPNSPPPSRSVRLIVPVSPSIVPSIRLSRSLSAIRLPLLFAELVFQYPSLSA